MTRTKIMIADAHPVMALGLAGLLEEQGYHCVGTCDSVGEAQALIAASAPDIIIADLMLSPKTGVDLLETLRDALNPVAVILYSADLSPKSARTAIEAGVNAIITKSAQIHDLLSGIATVETGQNWIDRSIMTVAMGTRDADAQWGKLSAAELRIARFAAQGLHNCEIADAAHLTEGTVKVHLNRVFRKLGISSRLVLVRDFQPAL